MKAISVQAPGGREKLRLIKAPEPSPVEGELTIDVAFAGVGFVDTLFRRGVFPLPMPLCPGLEVSGHVRAVGPGTTGFQVGDRVVALLNDFGPGRGSGGYAEIARARAAMTVQLPAGFDLEQAAALAVNATTAWMAVHEIARAKAGETALVSGATGGLGTLLGKVAKAAGLRVLAVVGSSKKKSVALGLGYDDACLAEELEKRRDGAPVDIAFDTVGGSMRRAAFDHLAPFGRLVVLGNASGEDVSISSDSVWQKTATVSGLSTGGVAAAAPVRVGAAATRVFALASEGGLGRIETSVLSLEEASEAHRRLEEREATGKILLRIPPR